MGGIRSLFKRYNEMWTGTRNPGPDPSRGLRPDQVNWDPETGRPIGLQGAPNANVAQDYQFKANELADQRRNARYNDAMNYLRQGSRLMESYRPGGLGALQSGLYSNMSQTSMALGDRVEAPDLLAGWRDEQAYKARKAARRGQIMNMVGQIGGAVVQAVAGAAGGPAAAAAAGKMQGNSGSPIGTPVGSDGNYQLGPGIGNPGSNFGAQTPGPFAGGYNQPGTAAAQEGGKPQPSDTEAAPTAAGGAQPEGGAQQQQGGGPMRGMQQPDQGLFDTYGLAQIQHFHATDDGFDDGIDLAIRHLTTDLMGAF